MMHLDLLGYIDIDELQANLAYVGVYIQEVFDAILFQMCPMLPVCVYVVLVLLMCLNVIDRTYDKISNESIKTNCF